MAVDLKRDYENEPLQNECMDKVDKTCMSDAQYRVNPKAKTDLLNTSCYNRTIDELQTNYTNLVETTDQLISRYINLTKETEQLMKKRDELQKQFPELENTFLEWKRFNSKTTEKMNWVQSRQECKNKGADLAIIDSQEEERLGGGTT
ncbi:hypothetical protein Baya_10662 [Bagarius yarrelli]|uniref:Uncharacterized protein n=1 Tax=Bagarius yarrelli TaxID=175774 RepID=A0A556UG50_BAGYA|nr:hypothetical protein Baya_10662 [Bagarius yarrelli]